MSTRRCSLRPAAVRGLAVTAVAAMSGLALAPAYAAEPTSISLSTKTATVAYGQTLIVDVAIDSPAKGAKPVGKASVMIGGSTVLVDIANSGKGSATLPLVNASSTPYAVTGTFAPTDAATFAASSTTGPLNVTVTKDNTTSAVSLVYKKARKAMVAKNKVTSAHGQVVNGKAKFVLKRNGTKVAAMKVALNAKGVAKAKFAKITKRGNYKIVSKYLGATNFNRSKGAATLAI